MDVDVPSVAVLGGSEAFGRFVPKPYPALLRDRLGASVVNLSVMHAGLTLLRRDPGILGLAAQAETVVLQLPGAQNMSNPFYAVHPRRNDRFIAASDQLEALYPQVDFTGFHFTGHLLQTLETIDPWAFEAVVETLRATWIEDMLAVLDALPAKTILLWMSTRSADDKAKGSAARDPVFVDRGVIAELHDAHAGLVEVVASPAAVCQGIDDMRFAPGEADMARLMPGPLFHEEVADALAPVLAAQRKRRAGNADAPPLDQSAIRASR